jgi:cellulose synthase/poly-beta-1,6-N-acetylglucosamine synthase-like glycosyltransferase
LIWLWLQPFSELLAALRKLLARGSVTEALDSGIPRLLFLVPAHDEELLIEACARSILSVDYPAEARDLIVIADNCSDRTAELARGAGAQCMERTNPELPGKPRALEWTIASVPIERWDSCIVIDADSVVDPGFARALAARGELRGRVFQAYFGMSNEWDNWLTRLGGVLTRLRYDLVFPLKRAVGLNCPLTGNGMCLGTDLLAAEGWRAFSLTEDCELYARYTAAGIAIEYVSEALLHSIETRALGRAGTQRRRWMAGRFSVLRAYILPILRGRISRHQKLDALAELAAPTPILHVFLALVTAAVALLTLPRPVGYILAAAGLGSLLWLVVNTIRVLIDHPQPIPTLIAFAMLPLYVAWRLPLALLTFVTIRNKRWEKTERFERTSA